MSGHRVLHDLYKAPFIVLDPGDAGTINVDRWGGICSMTSAGAETRILAAPLKAGLKFTVAADVAVGTITLTVTGGFNNAVDTTLAFAEAGDVAVFDSIKVAGLFVWRLANPATTTQVAHIADPAVTGAVVGDVVATNNGWGASSEANFDSMHVAIDANVVDIAANNAAIDAILVALETAGITAAS